MCYLVLMTGVLLKIELFLDSNVDSINCKNLMLLCIGTTVKLDPD